MKKLSLILLVFISPEGIAQNVGIGTASPAFKLDVAGRMRVKTGTLNNVGTSSGIWLEDYRDGTNRIFIGMQDSIRTGFYGSGTGAVGWGFNFNAKSGNVGIGRTASSSILELNDIDGAALDFFKNNDFAGRLRATDSTLQLFSQTSLPGFPSGVPAKNLILQPPAEGFSANAPGNVGIGVNDPQAQLHVGSKVMIGTGTPANGYALSVNGKIIGEELKIQNDAAWPDYVFGEKYKLPSIEQMSDFIKDNSHLPNIPPAKEVEKDGILVGNMQIKMMEKIEELSLYIIQLNDRIKQLESVKK